MLLTAMVCCNAQGVSDYTNGYIDGGDQTYVCV